MLVFNYVPVSGSTSSRPYSLSFFCLSFLSRIKYGINSSRNPVFFFSVLDSRFHGNDISDTVSSRCSWSTYSNAIKDMSLRIGRPFRKIFTSPQGEEFPPSPMGTLKMISSFLDRGIAFICASRIRAPECVKPSC